MHYFIHDLAIRGHSCLVSISQIQCPTFPPLKLLTCPSAIAYITPRPFAVLSKCTHLTIYILTTSKSFFSTCNTYTQHTCTLLVEFIYFFSNFTPIFYSMVQFEDIVKTGKKTCNAKQNYIYRT